MSRTVAEAAAREEDSAITFDSVSALADETAGVASAPALALPPERRRAPRLTEPWFC